MQGWLLGLMAISDQTRHQVDKKVDRAAMARVFDLRDVLEVVIDGLDNGAFAQQQFVRE